MDLPHKVTRHGLFFSFRFPTGFLEIEYILIFSKLYLIKKVIHIVNILRIEYLSVLIFSKVSLIKFTQKVQILGIETAEFYPIKININTPLKIWQFFLCPCNIKFFKSKNIIVFPSGLLKKNVKLVLKENTYNTWLTVQRFSKIILYWSNGVNWIRKIVIYNKSVLFDKLSKTLN